MSMRPVYTIIGLVLAAPAFATTPASTPSSKPAAMHLTGTVKALDASKHTITVAANGKDSLFSTAGVTLAADVKVGATVDVTYAGGAASAVNIHH